MHQRKKNQNKENFKTIKKTTLQQINYTQQLHIPTFATMDLRQAGRSIELKKSSSKKPASRKSRCISVKQQAQQGPLNIKQLLKQFKSMKLIRSRSKSPKERSKQKNKKSTKKLNLSQPNSKTNSQINLTAKLQRTLQKLKQQHYFKDQDESEIPLVSTSQAFTQLEKNKLQYFITPDNFDDINIRQLRLFCKNKENTLRVSLDYFKGNIFQIMARRIQRAWRRYRTHKLVQRYANILNFSHQQMSANISKISSDEDRQQIMIQSQQLYPQEMIQRKITYISNLQEQGEQIQEGQRSESEDPLLYQLKKEQLQKWSQIISIINSNRSQNPQQTEKLLRKLINQSQINRKNLQLKPERDLLLTQLSREGQQDQKIEFNSSEREQQPHKYLEEDPEYQIQKLKKRLHQHKSSISSDSMKHEEEFNSKKYIEYLDSDMYPIVSHQRGTVATIGKKKQQVLLNKLQGDNSIKRLIRGSKILGSGNSFDLELNIKSRLSYRSNSDFSSTSSIEAEELKSSRKISSRRQGRLLQQHIKKSNSQKNIKYTSYQNLIKVDEKNYETFDQEANSKQLADYLYENQIYSSPKEKDSTDKRERQMKEMQPPSKPRKNIDEDLDFFMKRELEEIDEQTLKFIEQHPDSQNQITIEKSYLEEEFKKQIEELHRIREEDSSQGQNQNQNQNSEFSPVLHRSGNEHIQKVSIQNYDHNIESDEESDNGIAEKGQSITEMIATSLIFQFLRQIGRYSETILKSFKNAVCKKPKLKRAQSKGKKKNGFTTTQAQIKGFIQDLCSYVINQQPHIYKNLQKATGPSALEMLRYMHQSVQNDIYIQEQQDDPSIMILPNWVFQTFWSRRSQSIKYERQGLQEERQNQRQQYLKGLNKIFLRSCFDCLNECLDFERNFGPFGKPFPWKRSHYFQHIKTLEQTKKSVKNAQKRLFQVSSTYCGIIIEKDQIASLGGNQQYIAQVQQDRLSRMLAQDLVQGQDRWIFYDDEETQLLVQSSNTIFHELLDQVMNELRLLNSKCYYF